MRTCFHAESLLEVCIKINLRSKEIFSSLLLNLTSSISLIRQKRTIFENMDYNSLKSVKKIYLQQFIQKMGCIILLINKLKKCFNDAQRFCNHIDYNDRLPIDSERWCGQQARYCRSLFNTRRELLYWGNNLIFIHICLLWSFYLVCIVFADQ